MRLVLGRRAAGFRLSRALDTQRFHSSASAPSTHRLDALDITLVCLFLIGLYTNYTIPIAAKLPFPSAPSGVAGVCLLWRRRHQIDPMAFTGFIAVLLLYL